MSKPASNHRHRLGLRIALLVLVCAVPLIGLSFYFLSTGLHHDIATAERERAGLRHVQQTVSVLQHAIRLTWSETGDDAGAIAALEQEIGTLEALEGALGASLGLGRLSILEEAGQPPASGQVRVFWQDVLATSSGTRERRAALRQLVSQLHENLFQSCDASGLSSAADNAINGLTDIVSVALPLQLEHLLHLHERIAPDLREDRWDAASREAATLFARQLAQRDVPRLRRSVAAALRSEDASLKRVPAFRRDYPPQALAFMEGLQRFSGALDPAASPAPPDVRQFDRTLHATLDATIVFWRASIGHLDTLLRAQIADAKWRRNQAVLITAGLSMLLLPLAWLCFRRFLRPVIRAMVDEATESRRQAEEALGAADESQRRLRQTQAALDDHCAIVVLDLERRVVSVNGHMSSISGYTREELVGRPLPFIDAGAHPPAFLDGVWAGLAAGHAWRGNLRGRTRDGRVFWVDATVFPFRDAGGRPVEFIAIQTDVTETVRARELAEGAAVAKSQFLAMMSHEIRTPMNGVLGFAHLLADTPLDDTQRDYVRTILMSGESLMTIINDVLDFSKLEAGRTELEARPLALRLLIEDVIDLLANQARQKGLELVYWIEPGLPEGIVGDETRLRQVLLNLVGNAVKFTAAGHVEIVVEGGAPGADGTRRITFHVRDTGIGIPAERRDRLFKAFSQVDTSITRHYGGTGLGLAISQRLVGLMGGDIRVDSEPGRGSDFSFTLKAREADVAGQLRMRVPAAFAEIGQALKGRRVLVVDDLPANRRLFEKILTLHGAEVASAASATEALTLIEHERFDVAVLDYRMPGSDGVQLAQAIRARPGNKDLPLILAASVTPGSADVPAGLFTAVLVKPVRNLQFVAAVAHVFMGDALAPARPAALISPFPSSFAAANPLRIFVVDDNAVNLKVISAMLAALGYAPELFAETPAALAALRERPCDLVLMDVQMPVMDGHEATRRLRAGLEGELNRRTRIVALTAGALPEERDACLAAGMDDFLAKPISRGLLLDKLKEAANAAADRRDHPGAG